MNSLTARWVYCAGLFFVTACAVLPEQLPASAPAPAVAAEASATPEQQLARVMRERIELERRYGDTHPAIARAAATEVTLREFAISANPASDPGSGSARSSSPSSTRRLTLGRCQRGDSA